MEGSIKMGNFCHESRNTTDQKQAVHFGHVDINFDDMLELRMSTDGTSTNYLKSAIQVAFIQLSTLKEL